MQRDGEEVWVVARRKEQRAAQDELWGKQVKILERVLQRETKIATGMEEE